MALKRALLAFRSREAREQDITISAPRVQTRPTPAIVETEALISTVQQRHTSMPGFQFMSDLHLERTVLDGRYDCFEIPVVAPYLVLAGDVGRFCDRTALETFLAKLCTSYRRIFYVPGNHEFYGGSREEGLGIAGQLDHDMGPCFSILHRTRVDLEEEDIVLLGCTLHSVIPDDATGLTNDFGQIGGWRIAHHNAEHLCDREWLQTSLQSIHDQSPQKRVIVVTHYAPAFESTVHPHQENNEYRHCFCSDVLHAFQAWPGSNQVTHWIFGHTHHNARFQFGSTLVLSNQPNDDQCVRKFDPRATV